MTDRSGDATLYGSIWTEDPKLSVGGSAVVYYCSDALASQSTGGGASPVLIKVG